MNQAVMIINCYLYGATAVMLLVLVLIVYLRGQVNHFPNPFAKKNLVYKQMENLWVRMQLSAILLI